MNNLLFESIQHIQHLEDMPRLHLNPCVRRLSSVARFIATACVSVVTCIAEPGQMGAASRSVIWVGMTEEQLPIPWRESLDASGWSIRSFYAWDEIDAGVLGHADLVVLVRAPRRPEPTALDRERIRLLQDYVAAGGGLMITQAKDQMWNALTLPQALLRAFGSRILIEKTYSDPALTRSFGSWEPDTYTYTEGMADRFTGSVTGLWYQSYMDFGSLPGVLPFLPEAPWEVVLEAGPGSRSEVQEIGLESVDREARAAGFGSHVPLAGIRAYGSGKVAYLGLFSPNVFARPLSSEADREVFRSAIEPAVTFLVGLFDELAGRPAAALRPFGPPVASPAGALTLFRGLIGPRTVYSNGRSTPADYAAAARTAGLDFIVFLEDFAALKPGGFAALKEDCRALSDAQFLAVPGITYQNTDGNHQYAFGGYLDLPSTALLDASGTRMRVHVDEERRALLDLHWLYGLLGFFNHSGWYRFGDNPYPASDARAVNSMAVLTQEGGMVVDRQLDAYAREARNGQYLWPLALSLMKSADEVARVRTGAETVNIVGAHGLAELDAYFSERSDAGRQGRPGYPDTLPFGTMQLSAGPIIQLDLPRGDTDPQGDLFSTAFKEWPLKLIVTSTRNLREVRLMDGDHVLRRFVPQGPRKWLFFRSGTNRFEYATTLTKERQRAIWVHATDESGAESISRDVVSDSFLLREHQLSDRFNQTLYSMQRRPDGSEYFVGYGGDTAIPDKGPWNGRIRPVGCFVFDKRWGLGSNPYDGSPEDHPQAQLIPFLSVNSVIPEPCGWSRPVLDGVEGAPHVQPRRVVASSDVLIGERILDGVFAPGDQPVIHVWSTLFPVRPSAHLATTARTTFHLPKVDGIVAYEWEQDFTLRGDAQAEFYLGSIGIRNARDLHGVPAKGETRMLNPGEHVVLAGSPFGSLAVYALTEGVGMRRDGSSLLVSASRSPVRLLLVGMNTGVADPVSLAEALVRQYGLDGAGSAYTMTAEDGHAVDTRYELTLAAGPAGFFRGAVKGLRDMAGNLGCTISGLHEGWPVVLSMEGKKWRYLPCEGDRAYAVLRAEDEQRDLIIGHPVTADDPGVVLNLMRDRIEVHNPTARRITTRICMAPEFGMGGWEERVVIPAGSSLFFTMEKHDEN